MSSFTAVGSARNIARSGNTSGRNVMERSELVKIGSSLTVEDLGELLDAFFHARNRVNELTITVTARRLDTYSPVERLDFDASNALILSA